VVRLFLEKGADINAENKRGQTALHCAVARERPNIDAGIKSDGMAVVELFLEKGADINRTDRWGMTALHEAAAK
jgi:ankyrin repeat protein